MRMRGSLWMADWRDEHGTRHRKGFKTKAAALRHQTKQQLEAARKKARASARSPKWPRPGQKAQPKARTAR